MFWRKSKPLTLFTFEVELVSQEVDWSDECSMELSREDAIESFDRSYHGSGQNQLTVIADVYHSPVGQKFISLEVDDEYDVEADLGWELKSMQESESGFWDMAVVSKAELNLTLFAANEAEARLQLQDAAKRLFLIEHTLDIEEVNIQRLVQS